MERIYITDLLMRRAEFYESIGRKHTAAKYRQTAVRFTRDCGKVLASRLDRITLERWIVAMKDAGLKPNTIDFYFRMVKAAYNRAVDDELIHPDSSPFLKVHTKPEPTIKRALTIGQLRTLMELDPATEGEEAARDAFILCFYLLGMPPVDLWKLRPTDIRNRIYSYRRQKTGSLIEMEVPEQAITLMSKFGRLEDGRLALPSAESVCYHLKKIGKRMNLPFPLTLYCARHTWATSAQHVGTPVAVISQGMGHSNEETTRIYLAGIRTEETSKWNRRIMNAISKRMKS